MSIGIDGIKNIIRECMEELKEACGSPHAAHTRASSGYPLGGVSQGDSLDPYDEDQGKMMWKSFVDETLGPDDRFRRNYVLQAMGDQPKILESVLEAISENQELIEEIYKAVEELRNKVGR